MSGARVVAVARALPERVVPNGPIAERLGVTGAWIAARTGIEERRYAADGTTVADLATAAARMALARAGVEAGAVDLILVATSSADDVVPNIAPQVAHQLDAHSAAAIDVGAACTGWISALALATGQLEAGRARTALVIGAEIMSRLLDADDRRTAGLFGDGAGAVLLERTAQPSRLAPFVLGADGSGADAIAIRRRELRVRMDGHTTYQHAVRRLADAAEQALAAAGADADDIDLYVFHQANGRILAAVAERLALPADRVLNVIARYGNTSAASIPMALAHAVDEQRLRRGDTVLVAAFGAGFTWGAGVLGWG